ncbi:hypothetical protein [Rhizobium sp. 768_B6_N1_8]|uniref:hypothetical protein n=1 Tax=unclassified Rhizobium TaxID=2613769 RepID=UPI003F27328A
MSVITFPQKQYNLDDGGPIDKYVGANDNVPIDESGASAGFHVGGLVGPVADPKPIINRDYVMPKEQFERLQARGQYIGLTRPSSSDSGRYGDFMQTYTGRKFWSMDPRADEVFIEDIAHSLAMQSRYAGHCLRFYSVAEHCVLMARHLRWEGVDVALWALLHDSSESYLVDVPRPVKPYLTGYKAAEAKVMAAVCDRYGLPHAMPAAVHDADDRIIGDELVNLVPMDWHARHNNPLGVELRYWSPEKAEVEFMATFDALMDCRARGME